MALPVTYDMTPKPGKEAELERLWVTNILRSCPAKYVFVKSEGNPTTYRQMSYWGNKKQMEDFAKSARLMEQVAPLLAQELKLTWYEIMFEREARR